MGRSGIGPEMARPIGGQYEAAIMPSRTTVHDTINGKINGTGGPNHENRG